MANIAILGWGSLINEPGTLKSEGGWQTGGPILPIEYSRISQSRDGALTLVIDPVHGTLVETFFAKSGCTEVSAAVADLQNRERTREQRIGVVDLLTRTTRAAHAEIQSVIEKWTKNNDFDAAIWTDLSSNFAEKSGCGEFSIENAISYLNHLPDKGRRQALYYFDITHEQIVTELRKAFFAKNI